MLKIIGILMVVWLGFVLLGALVKGLFWLLVIGVVLLAGTVAYGAIRRARQREIR